MNRAHLNAKTSLRQKVLRQVRALLHTLADSVVTEELCDGCAEDVLGASHAYDETGLGFDDVLPGTDSRSSRQRMKAAIRKRINERAHSGAPVDPHDVASAAVAAGVTKSREYPMGLVPEYVSSMLAFRDFIKTDVRDGKTVIFMDPIEATPELLAALGNSSQPLMVSPGGHVYVTGRPQVMFRPELVSIESELAPSFAVTDIKIGKNSQFVSANEILAEEFLPGRGRRMKFDVCQVSMDVTVSLRNLTDKPVRAPHVTLYGPTVE